MTATTATWARSVWPNAWFLFVCSAGTPSCVTRTAHAPPCCSFTQLGVLRKPRRWREAGSSAQRQRCTWEWNPPPLSYQPRSPSTAQSLSAETEEWDRLTCLRLPRGLGSRPALYMARRASQTKHGVCFQLKNAWSVNHGCQGAAHHPWP